MVRYQISRRPKDEPEHLVADLLKHLAVGETEEDYAIVKYARKSRQAFPSHVKIVILKNTFPNEDHAAVATRVDGQWLILDNRTLTMVRDTELRRAIPKFVLDHEGVKRFKLASRNRQAAS